MPSISHKANQLLVLLIKLLIVGCSFYFIYNQLANNNELNWVLFLEKFDKNKSVLGVSLILLLSILNRLLEILKWQNLVSYLKSISIFESTKQVLSALTAGLFTPNGVGEYAGKVLFFEKFHSKNIIFLNLICNGVQVVVSLFFGIIGLFYLGYFKWDLILIVLIFGLSIVLFTFKKIKIKGYSIEILIQKLNKIPKKIHQKNSYLAVCRYLIFSHQYYFLFLGFDVQLPYFTLMAAIASVYFLASSLPTFQFLDFAVKGSVALYFFGKLGINEWIVVFITTLFWFLNVVLPSIIGSYFVLVFKPKKLF